MTISRDVEFRIASEDERKDGKTLVGYAAVFDTNTEINSWEGKFTERIAPGAFAKTLRDRKPIMQWDHGRDTRFGSLPIGVYDVIEEDGKGLRVEGRLFDHAADVRAAIEGGAVTGMSFKFQVVRDEWRDEEDKLVKGDALRRALWDGTRKLTRTIKEIKLFEAGPVSTPAYKQTSVGIRAEEPEVVEGWYERSALAPKPDEEAIRSWLDAENTYNWLEAEKRYTEDVEAWLEAEQTYKDDAAREGTSSDKENRSDADDSVTSQRDVNKKNATVRTRAVTLNEMRESLAIVEVRIADVEGSEEFRAESELDAEVQKQYDADVKEAKELRERIEKVEARLEAIKGGKGHAGDGANVIIKRKAEDIRDVDALRKEARSEDDFVRLATDNAKRVIDEVRFSNVIGREDAQENALRTLNEDTENGELALRFLNNSSAVYERAWAKTIAAGTPQGLTPEEYRELALGADAKGGYAVPVQLDPTVILTTTGVIDPLRSISRVERIVGKEWQGVTSDGTSVTRAAEGEEADDNSFTLAPKSVRTNRVQGFIPFSYELAETWSQVRSEITRALVDAKQHEEATSFMLGDGTGNNANGLITTLSGNLVDTAAIGTFASGDIYDLEVALDARYRTGNAKFVGNHAVYSKIRQFADADGHDLWARIGAGQPNQILGYDALESTAMTGTIANSAKLLVFGDFSNFLIVDRIGMSVELIPQVFGPNGRPTGQRGIYAIWMNNSKVLVDKAFKVLRVKAS